MNNDIKALKSGVWYTISDFLLRAIGLITTPIFARLLTHEDFGLFNNFHSWQLIFNVFISLNFVATLISAKYDFEDEFDSYILSISVFSVVNAAIILSFVNLLPKQFTRLMNMDMKYINMMIVYVLFSSIFSIFQARERYLFRYKSSVLLSLMNSFGSTIVAVLFVMLWTDKLLGRIVGMIIPTIIIGIFIFLYLARKGKTINSSYLKYALPICLPYIPHSLSLILLSSMDKIQITSICGAEDTALYSLAYTCGSAITIFISSMNNAYAPWLGEKLNSKDFTVVRNMSKIYINGFFCCAVAVVLFTPELLLIMGGKSYEEARFVMAPVALGIIYQFIYTMFVNIEQFNKNTKPMALATMTAALFNYVANALLIPLYGYIAAAYTTAASYLVLLLLHMFIVYKMNLNHIYDYKQIVLITLAGMAVTVMMKVLYLNNIVRYSCARR